MTIKLSEPMRNVLMKLGDGWGWDDFGITGPLSYAARLRTCCALAKQGLVTSTHGDFNLTDAGEALAKQLKDQAKLPRISIRYGNRGASALHGGCRGIERHASGFL